MSRRRYTYSYSPSPRRERRVSQKPSARRGWLLLFAVFALVGAVLLRQLVTGDDGSAVARSNCWTQVACSAERVESKADESSSGSVDAQRLHEPPPAISAAALAVLEEPCGALVHGVNVHFHLPPASLTKIVTALVADEHVDLAQTVQVTVDGAALSAATDDLERRLGVRPGYGGKHAGGLTHNALLSLGEGSYLEIIARVPGAEAPATALPFGLGSLEEPRLATWAVAVDDIEQRVETARAAGYDPGEVIAGAREFPDGSRLAWQLAVRAEPAGDGLVPFLIHWQSEPHPSMTAPEGCRFVSLRAEHPEPESVLQALQALGVELSVAKGKSPRLIAMLETPNGVVELS